MGKEDYKNEKKGHGFLCVPKELLFDNRYKQLTIEAILLYAYMLDRLKLSIENGWKDSDGKVFIYFSLESIMDLLKCSKGKAISTLKELDEKHGIGLIEKKRSGYGKCSRIYVKEIFELSVSENEKTREKNEEDLEVTNKKHEKSKNKMSRSSKIEPIEVKKINPNNTNKSNTNKSNTKSNHIFRKDMEEKITIEQQIRTNIDYDSLLLTHREDVEQIDEIVNLISEILAKGDKRKIYIAGDMLDCEYVKERLGFMYSDDHGNSWNYVEADHNTGGATAEAQIVEMPDGSLKTYLRTGSGYIAEVTSIDGGETWSDRVPLTEIATTSYGTQLSVINYSQPIDGKPAIILSAPNATNGRKNGKIWIGLINETGQSGVNKYSVEWKYCYSVDTPQMGYSYSCLTELPDGKVGLLYEKYDSWSRNELHLKNILKYEKFTIDELKVQP